MIQLCCAGRPGLEGKRDVTVKELGRGARGTGKGRRFEGMTTDFFTGMMGSRPAGRDGAAWVVLCWHSAGLAGVT